MMRKCSRRGLIALRWRAYAQRFVGTHLIVFLAKAVQSALLLAPVGGRRVCGLLFQRAMHAFVSAILLRMPSFDALWHDAQLDPPYRQPRQPGRPSGRNRRAAIGSDGWRTA